MSSSEEVQHPFTEGRYRQFARHLEPGWEVLDVGCNAGRGGAAMVSACSGLTLDGTELEPERVTHLPPNIYREVYTSPIADLVAQGKRYDAAVLGELIEHIPYPDLDEFVVSTLALVRGGGIVALTTPNPHSLLRKMRKKPILGSAHVSVHCHVALGHLFMHHGASSCRVQGTGRSSTYLGPRFPLSCYGSYMLIVQS